MRSSASTPTSSARTSSSIPSAARAAATRWRSSFTGLKNLLYAIEWWIFGAFAVFIWWRWRRDAHAAVAAWESGEAAAVARPVDG